ncbi:response regulator [Salinicola salarius]|uniref:response regulator n=1 Tax=Salinicola salarius TaxID=430457 RepID=UPI0026E9BE35|nr:response regulator [Salinicola salarius]
MKTQELQGLMVSRGLIIFFILFSALLLGLAGWHAWEWCRANDQMLSRRLQSINRVFTPSLAEAAQNEDMPRVHKLLARLTSDPAIVNATLRDESGKVRDFTGTAPPPAALETLSSALRTWNHDGVRRWIQPLETFVLPQSPHRYWLDLSLDPLRANSIPDRPFSPWLPLLSLLLLIPLTLVWRRSPLDRTTRDRTAPNAKASLFPTSSLTHAPEVSPDSDLTYVSHELRAPLSGVLGFCRLLENSPLDTQQREWLRHIHLASTGLLDTVDHVLGDNRSRTDHVFDIAEVLWEILCLQTPLAQAKRMTLLAIVYDDVPPRLVGADIGIRQLLTNLINNAIKYGEEGDIVIRVVLESREGSAVRLRLSVSDGGSRDPSNRQRLQQALERGQAEAVDAKTGVGIAICQRLAAEMNGSLALGARSGKGNTIIASIGLEACEPYVRPAEFDLEGAEITVWQPHARLAYLLDYALKRWRARPTSLSEPDSLSATGDTCQLSIIGIDEKALEPEAHRIWQQRFDAMRRPCLLVANLTPTRPITWRLPEGSAILRLPISRYSLGRALARMLAEHRQQDLPPRPRVLVIDDDEVSQHYLDAVLPIIGTEVVVAGNAAEAIAIASKRTIDLVLVDLHLPDASGFEAIDRLRRLNREWKRKPVIAMTAEPNAPERSRSTNGAINEILVKPLAESLLRSVLAQYLTMPPCPPSERTTSPSGTDLSRTPPPLHAGDLPVVDKARARRVSGDREALAADMLAQLIAELPGYRHELNVAWQRRDAERLAEIAHQLGGGCRYCGALQLAAACDKLENRCRHHPVDACGEAFREVMAACDRLGIWADDQTVTGIH